MTVREGFNPDLEPDDLPSLGDPAVVGRLVHDFVGKVFDAYKDFQHGKATRDAAMGAIAEEARRCGAIIMGRDPGYHAPDFIRGGMLGAHIRAQDAVSFKEVPSRDPGEAFFRWLGSQAIEAAKALDEGMAQEEVGPRLQAILRSATNFILGLGA